MLFDEYLYKQRCFPYLIESVKAMSPIIRRRGSLLNVASDFGFSALLASFRRDMLTS